MSSPANPNDLTRHQLDELDALLQRMLSLPLGGTPASPPPPVQLSDIPPMPGPVGPGGGPGGNWRNDAAAERPAHRLPHTAAVPVMGDATSVAWGSDPLARYAPPPSSVPAGGNSPVSFRVPTLPPPSVEVVAEPAPLFGPPQTTVETPADPTPEPRTLRGVDAPALPTDYRPEPADEVLLTPAPLPVLPPTRAPASAAMFTAPAESPAVPAIAWPVYAVNGLIENALDLCGLPGRVLTYRGPKQLLGVCGIALVVLSAAWAARGYGLIDFPLPTTTSLVSAVGR